MCSYKNALYLNANFSCCIFDSNKHDLNVHCSIDSHENSMYTFCDLFSLVKKIPWPKSDQLNNTKHVTESKTKTKQTKSIKRNEPRERENSDVRFQKVHVLFARPSIFLNCIVLCSFFLFFHRRRRLVVLLLFFSYCKRLKTRKPPKHTLESKHRKHSRSKVHSILSVSFIRIFRL